MTLANENKFSCDLWQIDLNSATPNHVSLDNGRGGYIRWRTNPLILFTATGCQKGPSEEPTVSQITGLQHNDVE